MVRFLIIRFSSIGDIVLTTPVIRNLKQQVPGSEIHYLVKEQFASLLESNPYVDRVWRLKGSIGEVLEEMKDTEFDFIIDLHHNLRSSRIKNSLRRLSFDVNKLNFRKWLLVNLKINKMPDKHIVDRYMDTLRLFDVQNDEKGLDFFIPETEEVSPDTLPEAFRKGYIILVTGAQHETKKIPFDKLAGLCRQLEKPVIIVGGPAERETGAQLAKELPDRQVLNACGDYSINQSASLIRQALLIITPDTGMMHIAAAFGKNILSVWGNTVPEFGMTPYLPTADSRIFQVEGLPCRPCSKIGHQKCPKKHFDCMLKQDYSGIAELANRLTK